MIRDQIKVLKTEDFEEKGNNATMNEICEWIGVDQINWDDYSDFSHKKTKYFYQLNENTRNWLREFFKEPIKRLNSLVQLNLNWGY